MAILDRLTDAGRDRLTRQLTDLREQRDRAIRKKGAEVAAAQAEIDRLNEPRRRLERLQGELYQLGLQLERDAGALENQLRARDSWPRQLRQFAHELARFRTAWGSPLEVHEEVLGGGFRRVANLADFRKRDAAMVLLTKLEIELRDSLWRLDHAALRARLTEIRREMAPYDRDDLPLPDVVEPEPEPEGAA